jgi:hypothetical protein
MYIFLDVYNRGAIKLSIKNGKMSQDKDDIRDWINSKIKKFEYIMYNCDIVIVIVVAASKAKNTKEIMNVGKGYTGRVRKGQLLYLSAL